MVLAGHALANFTYQPRKRGRRGSTDTPVGAGSPSAHRNAHIQVRRPYIPHPCPAPPIPIRSRSRGSQRMSPQRSLDVLIIGAGHNGLVTAAYLARAGMSVRVL